MSADLMATGAASDSAAGTDAGGAGVAGGAGRSGGVARTPAPVRRGLAWLGALCGLVLVLGGAYQLILLASRDTFDVHETFAGVRALDVGSGGGDVTLTAAPAGAPLRVTEHVTQSLFSPTRRVVSGPHGWLGLSGHCAGVADQCGVSYDVTVPAGTSVTAHSGAGELIARGLTTSSPVGLSSGAGSVQAIDVSAPRLTLSAGAGDVTVTGAHTPLLDASSNAGNVQLALLSTPERVTGTSGAGDVRLTVPDAVYAVSATSDAGTVSDRVVRRDPSAARRITLHSGAGDVAIGVTPPR